MGDTQPYAEISIVIKDVDGVTTTINVPCTQDIRWEYASVPKYDVIKTPDDVSPGLLDLNLSFRSIFDNVKQHHYTIAKTDSEGNPIKW